MGVLFLFLLFPSLLIAWPDGAPCVSSTVDSMNPLEAVEHQGGLQLSEPPYEIIVDQRCYWRSQPIAFTLQGKNESIGFKGFAVQPMEYRNGVLGQRMGRLLRLDDNGSWQYQCFRFKDAATHSHNQVKKHMRMWWRNDDDDSRYLQLVATVVHSQKRFWVKSVLSAPIPPCRVQRDFGSFRSPMPEVPPPVKSFKQETDREFGNFFFNEAVPGEPNRGNSPNSASSFAFNFQQQQERERQQQLERERTEQRQREMERERNDRERNRLENERRERIQAERARVDAERNSRIQAQQARQRAEAARRQQLAQQQRGSGNFRTAITAAPSITSNSENCADIDPPSRCMPWAQYCQASTYMHQYCKRTCNFC